MSMYSDTRDAGTGWLIGAVKNNPEGLLLLAAGCALLMRSTGASQRRPSTREYDRNDLPPRRGTRSRTVGERLSGAAQSASEYVSDVSEGVAETASNYVSSASNYAEDVARQAAEQSGRIAREAQSTLQDTISRVVEDRPLAVALVGVAAGAAVAAAFPVTEFENRTLGKTGEELRDAASKAGENLKDAASKAGQRLAAAADGRGLNTEGVKEMVRDAGEAFSSALENEDQATSRTSSTTTPQSTANKNPRSPGKKGGTN
jgi:hypothetical protein